MWFLCNGQINFLTIGNDNQELIKKMNTYGETEPEKTIRKKWKTIRTTSETMMQNEILEDEAVPPLPPPLTLPPLTPPLMPMEQ